MVQALLTTVFFSISAICGNRGARMLGGVAANFYRIVIAAAVLGIWAHGWGGGLGGRALATFFISGLIGFGIGDTALYQAMPRIGSRLSVMIVHCLAAPFAATIEWAWLGTVLTPLQAVCSLTILAGVAVALAPGEHLHIPRKALSAGIVAAVIAALAQGSSSVVSRKAYTLAMAAGEHFDGITAGVTASYQRILGGVIVAAIMFVLMLARERNSAAPRQYWPVPSQAWKWVTLNGLAGPCVGVVFYQWALASTPTGIVLPIVALSPLVIVPFARVFENEKPTPRSLLGGAIAVLGVAGLGLGR